MSEKDQHIYKDRYMLRLPDGMRERIKQAASDNGRSMNAEIVHRLSQPLGYSHKDLLPEYDTNLQDDAIKDVFAAIADPVTNEVDPFDAAVWAKVQTKLQDIDDLDIRSQTIILLHENLRKGVTHLRQTIIRYLSARTD